MSRPPPAKPADGESRFSRRRVPFHRRFYVLTTASWHFRRHEMRDSPSWVARRHPSATLTERTFGRRRGGSPGPFRRDDRRRPAHRAARLDARRLPQDADPADRAARALRDHRHAAGGQLDPRARRACAARRSCWPRCRTRPGTACTSTPPPRRWAPTAAELTEKLIDGQAEVLLDLQLPDADLRRRRRDRLARRRRRDLQPGAAVPQLLRPLRAGDDPDLQGGVVPPAAGLRAAADDDARHRRPAGDGAGRRRTAGGGRR